MLHIKRSTLLSTGAIAVAGVLATMGGAAYATHSWNNYHWSTTDGVARPLVVDNTVGAWKPRVAIAMQDWNASAHIDSVTQSGTTNQKRCPMSSGTIQVCNSSYGQTGWLGIASISISGGHIVAGSTKLNDTYFAMPQYNTESWKQLVTCQELGHDYGLAHQNEDFNTDLTNSCMEYTSWPSGNEHPDAHDYQELALIYNHADSAAGTGGSTGPGKGKGKALGVDVGDSPAEWGKAIGKDAAGRPNEFVRNFNGYTIITHVTWAPDTKVGQIRH